MHRKFKDDGLDHIGSNVVCLIIFVLLVIIDKFDPNLVLININKLKPYMFIENKTLKHVN